MDTRYMDVWYIIDAVLCNGERGGQRSSNGNPIDTYKKRNKNLLLHPKVLYCMLAVMVSTCDSHMVACNTVYLSGRI